MQQELDTWDNGSSPASASKVGQDSFEITSSPEKVVLQSSIARTSETFSDGQFVIEPTPTPAPVSEVSLSINLSFATPELRQLIEELEGATGNQRKEILLQRLASNKVLALEYKQYLQARQKVDASKFERVTAVGNRAISAATDRFSENIRRIVGGEK